MADQDFAELADDPGFQKLARALLVFVRTGAWGHVTIRFQDGEIRQIDSLFTERVEEPAGPRIARPAA